MVDPKQALKILYNHIHKTEQSEDNWKPQIGDYIKTSTDIKTRFGNIREGSRGKIQKIHSNNKYGCVIFSIHQAVILDKKDIKKYTPKKYKDK